MENHWYQNFEAVAQAPVFEPKEEEFKDSLAYIAKIKPIAENYGIVRIKPPPSWQPPFAINVDQFSFTPRIQKLNELEAISRIKINFINKIAKFWHLQGTVLKVPLIDGKYLDLYKLHRNVQQAGGYDKCIGQRKWPQIAKQLGFKPPTGVLLKSHYHKLLRPFDLYESGQALEHATSGQQTLESLRQQQQEEDELMESASSSVTDDDGSADTSPSTSAPMRQVKTRMRLTPREIRQVNSRMRVTGGARGDHKGRGRQKKNPIDSVYCMRCRKGDEEEKLLLCDQCDDSYHTFCLLPPLSSVPKGDWRCPQCVTEEVTKPPLSYGFEQAPKSYTLKEFGDVADKFKRDFFGMPCHMVPSAAIEREFWKQVVRPSADLGDAADGSDGDVGGGGGLSVMYGADLFTEEVGSGFPRATDTDLDEKDKPYVSDSWNLNNMPVLPSSVLSHITTDISGMMVPWCYVGQCFSTFCWHTEDHWSYSINYLHWGEPKHWYGVSSKDADKFEATMRSLAPELFTGQPDLLHHIVTIMNPRVLAEKGVPIYSTTQEAGEFVITFPRSYHAGFNQGFNFAEAVNFCPADWLQLGRQCIDHYSDMRRSCVFSHDELVCNMASLADELDIPMSIAVYRDLLKMIELEKGLRKKLLDMGVHQSKKELFELVDDDHRQCALCTTTLYLSGITCPCDEGRLVCLKHAEKLCKTCSPKKFCLRYRYTLDELPPLMTGLLEKTKRFDDWVSAVKIAIAAKGDTRIEMASLKELLEESKRHHYPQCETLTTLAAAVKHAERCAAIADQLIAHKMRTRNRQSGSSNYAKKLKLEEVEAFSEQIDKLICRIPQAQAIRDFVTNVHGFLRDAHAILPAPKTEDEVKTEGDNLPNQERRLESVRSLFDKAVAFDLQLPELIQLKRELEKLQWVCAVDRISNVATGADETPTNDPSDSTPNDAVSVKNETDEAESAASIRSPDRPTVTLERLRQLITDGINLPAVEVHTDAALIEARIARLQHLLETAEKNQQMASTFLKFDHQPPMSVGSCSKRCLSDAQTLLTEQLHRLPPAVKPPPAVEQLKHAVKKASDWLIVADESLTSTETSPTLGELDRLLGQAKSIPLDLGPMLDRLKTRRRRLDSFLGDIENAFQKFPAYYSIAEILSPRMNLSGLVEGQPCPLFPHRQRSRHEEWAAVCDQYELGEQMLESLKRKADQESLLLAKWRGINSAVKHLPVVIPPSAVVADQTDSTDSAPSVDNEMPDKGTAPPPASLTVAVPTVSPVKQQNTTVLEMDQTVVETKRPVTTVEICLCRSSWKGDGSLAAVLQCRLCCEIYHVECVAWDSALSSLHGRYLCPRCCKGKRPLLDSIATLLSQQQATAASPRQQTNISGDTVVAPSIEETLIRRCVDIAQAWKEEARQWLESPEVRRIWGDHQTDQQQVVPDLAKRALDKNRLTQLIESGLNLEVTIPELQTLFELEDVTSNSPFNNQQSALEALRCKPAVSPTFELSSKGDVASTEHPLKSAASVASGRKRQSAGGGGTSSATGKKGRQMSYHDDEQSCSGEYCLRPTGNEVNWVQCESGCEQWFHIVCVGLTVQSVNQLDQYTCYKCKMG